MMLLVGSFHRCENGEILWDKGKKLRNDSKEGIIVSQNNVYVLTNVLKDKFYSFNEIESELSYWMVK
jgi:hypothetical protein